MGEATNTLATIDVVIIASFLLFISYLGYALSRRASRGIEDYFLGGHQLPWWALGASTATSNFDMAGTMIITAMVFSLGYQGFLVELRGGVGISLALIMVFLAKWQRRSRVMTTAEWMKLRFGTGRQGKVAHLLCAISQIALSLGMVIYFAKGAGSFLVYFMPLDAFGGDAATAELFATVLIVGVGLIYTILSGLYGVVFTDVAQIVLMLFTAIYVAVRAFGVAGDVSLPDGFLNFGFGTPPPGMGEALLASDPGWSSIFELFGLCVTMWVVRTLMEGMAGVGGYTDQRFFAARNEREASLLTFESILLSIFRWMMVAGLVVLGYELLAGGGPAAELIASDPEKVLPVVLGEVLPSGIRGIAIAGLIAAAMSTFDSTLNAGASYVVRDIYQAYLRPQAEERELVRVSRIATFALCVFGVALAASIRNINEIWNFITMGLGAGMFVPLFLRWYWPRFNGYGFAAGTAGGLVGAIVFNQLLAWPIYLSFPSVVFSAGLAAIPGTLLTSKTPDSVLMRFWLQINPWGAWRDVEAQALIAGLIRDPQIEERRLERSGDRIAVIFALLFQVSVLIASMALIFHDWNQLIVTSVLAIVGAVGLYRFWYCRLSPADDAAD